MARPNNTFRYFNTTFAGSNLKFTDYLSRNPVGGAIPEELYEEEYVINILTEHAKLNLKHGRLFADQSKHDKNKPEIRGDATEAKDERNENQSQTNTQQTNYLRAIRY